jgi:hypothetical protein
MMPDAPGRRFGNRAWDTIRNVRRFGHVPRGPGALMCIALVVLVAGCGTACRCCRSGNVSMASAPERVVIDGREYTLAASAWRDFQPVAPPDGQPLIVVVMASPSDMMPLPDDLAIDRVWVLKGEEQWSAAPEEPGGRGESPATRLEVSARNGPKWGPGIEVDVVVRLKQGKKTWLVRAPGVDIKRTD